MTEILGQFLFKIVRTTHVDLLGSTKGYRPSMRRPRSSQFANHEKVWATSKLSARCREYV